MSFYSHAQIPRYQGQGKKKTSGQESGAKVTCTGGRGRLRARSSQSWAACPFEVAFFYLWQHVTQPRWHETSSLSFPFYQTKSHAGVGLIYAVSFTLRIP